MHNTEFRLESTNCKAINTWKLKINIIPNNEAEITGVTIKRKGCKAYINPQTRTIVLETEANCVGKRTRLNLLASNFATICFDNKPLRKNRIKLRLGEPATLHVLAEDGSVENEWKIHMNVVKNRE
jgi:hypothetical protein